MTVPPDGGDGTQPLRAAGVAGAAGVPGAAGVATSIEIRLPAEPEQLPLLRGVAGVLAGAQDYDIDTIADLRMAVDELAATVIRRAPRDSSMRCLLTVGDGGITVVASAPAADSAPVDRAGFGWMVLTTLASEVSCGFARAGHAAVTGQAAHADGAAVTGQAAHADGAAVTGQAADVGTAGPEAGRAANTLWIRLTVPRGRARR